MIYIFFLLIVHGFDKAVYDVMEGSKAVMNFTVNVKGTPKERDLKLALFGTVTSENVTAGTCFLDIMCVTIFKTCFSCRAL